MTLVLAPRPRQLETTGDGAPLTASVTENQVEGLPEQGFEVGITAHTVTLTYSDDAGRRYGQGFLAQVKAQVTDNWPALTARDWPDYKVRGYMLDISRGRVPTRETLERIVEILALVRINHLQLYTEHTFAYKDHEAVWRNASPMTADDIQWLDSLCVENGIELVANQNTFGHMERWFEQEAYLRRAEKPEGFEVRGRHRPPATLAPTQENADFVLGLLDELLPNFRSKSVNIGCDETWELGEGYSADDANERGKGRVYLDHLRRILVPLLEKGYRPQFWGDIIYHYPELVADLPNGATAVAWIYQAPRELDEETAALFGDAGLDPAIEFGGFAARSSPFIEAGYPFWVAPGTSGWLSLIGRLDNAYANLVDAAEVGGQSGAGGYLITDWGDHGHLQPPSVSFGPLIYGASVSWALEANRDLDVRPVLDKFVLDEVSGTLSGALEALGRAYTRTGQDAFNTSPLQAALFNFGTAVGEPDAEKLTQLVTDLDAAIATIENSNPGASDGEIIKRELIAATRLARHGAWRLLRKVDAPHPSDEGLRADLEEAIRLHCEAWLLRSRPGGINVGIDELVANAPYLEESA